MRGSVPQEEKSFTLDRLSVDSDFSGTMEIVDGEILFHGTGSLWAEFLGFSKDECVVIEDSITGVTASVRAGIRVLGLVNMSSKEELIEAGAEPFTNMHELPKLLGL